MTGPDRSPNLFLVGVQRSATTAMWTYLSKHPDVFMAAKEPHYFGSDLAECDGVVDPGTRLTLDEYLGRFRRATDERYLGDASVGYIYSRTAASEIREFSPEARIVASFRNPVDMTHSVFNLLSFQGAETTTDFATAVDDDRPRWAYTHGGFKWGFTYRRLVAYAEQLERYLDAFGPERVHIVIYEDLADDVERVYRDLLGFLEVDQDFRPELPVVFASRHVRSNLLQRFLWESPEPVRRAVRLVLPNQARRRRLGARMVEHNWRAGPRPEIDPALRRRLEGEFAGEVARFSALVGRDLGARWFGVPGRTVG